MVYKERLPGTRRSQVVGEIGYDPEVILAGRRINDSMGGHVAGEVIKLMARKRHNVVGAKILVLGLTFKGNCPDLRNGRVVDVVREFSEYNVAVDVSTLGPQRKKRHEYGITLVKKPQAGAYDGIILVVAQREFREMGQQAIRALGKALHVLLELRYVLLSAHAASDLRL